MMITLKCRQCGIYFETKDKRRKYCAVFCYRLHQSEHPNSGCFTRGLEPWNKNLKGIHLSPSSEFRPGQPSTNILPIHTIRIRTNKKDGCRNFIKIANPNKWEELAKYVWKKKYGRLYPGDVVHHLNGKKTDDTIRNLIALPRSHHPIYHSKWGLKTIPPSQLVKYRKRYSKVNPLFAEHAD